MSRLSRTDLKSTANPSTALSAPPAHLFSARHHHPPSFRPVDTGSSLPEYSSPRQPPPVHPPPALASTTSHHYPHHFLPPTYPARQQLPPPQTMASSTERNYVYGVDSHATRRSSFHAASLQQQHQHHQQQLVHNSGDQAASAPSGSVAAPTGAGAGDTQGFPSLQAQTNGPSSLPPQHTQHPQYVHHQHEHQHPSPTYPPTSTAIPSAQQQELPHKHLAYHQHQQPQRAQPSRPQQQYSIEQQQQQLQQHHYHHQQQQPQHPASAQQQQPYHSGAPQYTYPPSPASPTLSPAQQQHPHQQQQYGRLAQPPPQQPPTGAFSPINIHSHHQSAAALGQQPHHPHAGRHHHHHHPESFPPQHQAVHDPAAAQQHQQALQTTPKGAIAPEMYKRDISPRNLASGAPTPTALPAMRRSRSTEWQGEYPSAACSYPETQRPTPSYAPPSQQQAFSMQQQPPPQQQQQPPTPHAPSSHFERHPQQLLQQGAPPTAVDSTGVGNGKSKVYGQIPPPIQTQWVRQQHFQEHHPSSPAVVEPRDCPPLSYHSGSSGYSMSTLSSIESSKISPTTPRSTTLYMSSDVARPSYLTESPIDVYAASPSQTFPRSAYPPAKHLAGFPYQAVAQPPLPASAATTPHGQYHHLHQQQQHPLPQQYHHGYPQSQQLPRRLGPLEDDHDMEHCSEQDDAREREREEMDRRNRRRIVHHSHHHDGEGDDDDHTDKLNPLHHDDGGDLSNKTRSKQMGRPAGSAGSKRKLEKAKSSLSMGDDEDTMSPSSGHYHPHIYMQSPVSSGTSSRKPSLTNSDDKPASGRPSTTKGKSSPSQKRGGSRQSSVRTCVDEYDQHDEHSGTHAAPVGHVTAGGRGLRHYSQRVCEYVREKGTTTYIKLVNELAGHGGDSEDTNQPTVAQEGTGQENIRRRVYDALNVLEAMGIIKMDKNEMEKKEIQWIGIAESKVVYDVTMCAQGHRSPSATVDEPDIESEEPGVDDMELERLEKETAALTLSNTILRAQVQDQITRHVQLVNLVKRNKEREARDAEAKEERRRRHEEKRRARREGKKRSDEKNMKEVVILRPDRVADRVLEEFSQPESDPQEEAVQIALDRRRKHRHRHHHRRSPRPEVGGTADRAADIEGAEADDPVDGEDHEDENDEESKEARRARRRERRERREKREQQREQRRHEKRLAKQQLAEQQQQQQQRQQMEFQQFHHPHHPHHYARRASAEESEEEQRIHLPMFVIKMPLYGCQSSDSEASINVVRRVREEQRPRKSGKNKRMCGGEETTMVQIQVPNQDELNVISDTEVLGEMGLNEISHQNLRQMLPKELMDNVQYATSQAQLNGVGHHPGVEQDVDELSAHHRGFVGHRRHGDEDEADEEDDGEGEDVEDDDEGVRSKTVWVRKGFERQVVLPRDSGYASAVSGPELSSSLDG